MAKERETVLVFSAHTDDFVIGAGGTIAKYAQEGKKVVAVVFSSGEQSHPWLRKWVVRKFRAKEAVEASKLLGCRVRFLGLGDLKVQEDYQRKNIDKKLLRMLNREKPVKIFTHSSEDAHISQGLLAGRDDHKAVHKVTMDLIEKMKPKKLEVYVYSIWTPISFKTHFPVLYVDISQTFGRKLRALNLFRSQRFNAIYPLMTLVFQRAILSGLKIRKRFGESFYRIR